MSAEKRKVATDALETLGTIIDENAGRDAIHLAVEPMIAAETLYAGQHVGVIDGKASTKARKKLGIVDPFIVGPVAAGSRFWFVVYPRQITSLRHVWSHPDFLENVTSTDVKKKSQVIPDLTKSEVAVPTVLSAEAKKVYDQIQEKNESQEWIQSFADRIPLKYEMLMEGAENYLYSGDYLCFGGLLEGESVPKEFWDHYEIVTGNEVHQDKRGSFFSCSC